MNQVGGVAERWEEAARRYKVAVESGRYEPVCRHFESAREKEFAELLRNFFSSTNPEWQAARKLLKVSGKCIVLKVVEKKHEMITYLLTHEGFRRVMRPEWPFSLEKHAIVASPLTFRSIAALLADGLAVESAESVFSRRIIQKIEEIVESSRLI